MLSTDTNPNGHDAMPGNDDDAPRTLDLILDPPIEWNNKTYETLHLEEPTADQVQKAKSELANNFNVYTVEKYKEALISHSAGVPRQVIGRMRISQFEKAADFLSTFIAAGRLTIQS